MARLCGRSLRGTRCLSAIPHGHWKTTTFVGGLRLGGMTAPNAYSVLMRCDPRTRSGVCHPSQCAGMTRARSSVLPSPRRWRSGGRIPPLPLTATQHNRDTQVFVVELTTVLSQLPNDQRVKLTLFVNDGPTIAQHFFAPAFTGSDFTNDVLTLSQPVRLYARCNNCEYSIRVNATRFGSNQGSGSVQLSFSGHLIDE